MVKSVNLGKGERATAGVKKETQSGDKAAVVAVVAGRDISFKIS